METLDQLRSLPESPAVLLPGGGEMVFRRIIQVGESAEFRMGQRGEFPAEEPVHRVRLTQPFALGFYPVTQEQFRVWTESKAYRKWFKRNRERIRETSVDGEAEPHRNDFEGKAQHPAERVTWWEARGYGEWLTELGLVPGGWVADLPSEAQWEYACRGGTVTDYWSGNGEKALSEVGWYGGNAGGETHRVGEKDRPNPFGLHDVHGNVAEWCLDYYDARRYRKSVEGAVVSALTDERKVEPGGAEPTHVAIAEAMRRYAGGQRKVLEEDGPALKWLRSLAEYRLENGGADWQLVADAVKAARRRLEWPEQAAGLAGQLRDIFQSWVESSSGTGSPDRVLRGGGWSVAATDCRSAFRNRLGPGDRGRSFGFRLALVPGPVRKDGGPEAQEAEGAAGTGARRDDAARVEAGPGAQGQGDLHK